MAQSSHRAKRMSNTLGESWGDAEYEDDTDGSIVSVSDASASDHEGFDHQTPLPPNIDQRRTVSLSPRDDRLKAASPQTPLRKSSRSSTPFKDSPSSNSKLYSPEPSFIMPSAPGSANGSPLRHSQLSQRHTRRRGPTSSTQSPQSSSRRTTTVTPRSKMPIYEDDDEKPVPPQDPVKFLWSYVLHPAIKYVGSVLGFALDILKPALGYVLIFFLTIYLLTQGSNMLKTGISNALQPICILPGSSYIIPFCATGYSTFGDVKDGNAEFEELMKVQSTFEDVLQTSVDGATLPVDMKRSEASIRDLRTLVKYSKLPSRNELNVEFDHFIDLAKDTGYRLTKFNSRIGRAVDVILSTNRWTIQILDGVKDRQQDDGLFSNALASLRGTTVHQAVFEQYTRHTEAIDEQIKELITEATALLNVLDELDQRLETIAMIATRDGVITKENREELLKHLWTRLGGNQSDVRKLEAQIQILNSVTMYKRQAWNHVSATLLKLQEISSGLEDLRERVATPGNVGYRDKVPLEFHLENIRLGVDRLETVRGETRRKESEANRRILDRAEGNDRGLPGPKGDMETLYPNNKIRG